jgi:RNA polymerase sigma factor (sigma-70 family)
MDVTNEQLIYGAGTGDVERFRLIVERYSNAVYAQVYSKVGDFHLAQDLTQEVFLKAHLHLSQLKEAGKIGAWLLAIANRVAIDWLRANGDRRFLENTVEVSNLLVEDNLAQTNAQDFVWEALSQLDEGSRTIVIMQMNGYRLEEIGTFLDLSDKAVDSRLRRAKQKLKKELVATMEQGIQRHKLGDAFVQKVVGTVLFPKDLFFPNDNMASAVMEKVKEAFRELYPHISMDTRTVANYTDKLRKYMAEGMPPDIILLGNNDYPEYDRRGWMLDLRPYLEADGVDLDDFVGPSLDISTVNGRILGIPMTVATTAVFYNKSWFDEAQLPYPQGEWTWEEFADIAAKLQEKHGDPKQWRYGASVLYHTNILEMIVLSKGGRFISPDGRTIRGYLDSEETISALEWVADHIHQHQTFAPMIDYGFRRLFGEGRMGLIVDYTDAFPGLLNKMGEGFDVAVYRDLRKENESM